MAQGLLWHRAAGLGGVTSAALLLLAAAPPRLTALSQSAFSAGSAGPLLNEALALLLRGVLVLALGAALGVLGGALLRRRLIRSRARARSASPAPPGTRGLRLLAAVLGVLGLGVLALRALVLLPELVLPPGGPDVMRRALQVLAGPDSPGQGLFDLALRLLGAGAALHLLAGGVALLRERRVAAA